MASYRHVNQEYYDQLEEQQLDPPHAIELARRAARVFRRVYEFDEDETVVMDFACGVGLISQELIPYSKFIVGVDISQRMVDEYNRRVANQGLSIDDMRAFRMDISNPETDEVQVPKESFDVVVCAASYHHFDDIATMTEALASFLKPGGSLLVIDLLRDDNLDIDGLFPEHREHNIVAHRGGFTQVEIEDAFVAAGLTSLEFNEGIKAKKKGQPVTLFIAQGIKPSVG